MEKTWYVEANVPYYIVQQESEDIENPAIRSAWEIAYFNTGNDAINYEISIIPEMESDNDVFNEIGEKLIGICVLMVVEDDKCYRTFQECIYNIPYDK